MPALEAEFGAGAAYQSDLPSRVLPVNDPSTRLTAREGAAPEDSLIPDLIALAHSHGTPIVFVRAPLPLGSRHLDQVPPEREAAALALLNALGAGWVDLHQLALPPDAFGDVVHAADPGRALISAALADALHAADILGGGSLPPARGHVRRRSLGASCAFGIFFVVSCQQDGLGAGRARRLL